MAQEIEFSIMATSAQGLQPLLDRFEAEQGIRVRLRLLTWDRAWSELVKAALYNDGPDLSEIGTTWLGDLVGMNALRPFYAAEVASFGGASAFFPSAWKSATQFGDRHVWAIPWLVGSRLIYYRPALLRQAGIDPGTAFQSIEQMEHTISSLQTGGVKYPWTVPTGYTHTTLLNAASWVWAAGGDFLAPDAGATRFTEPEAIAGLSAYFQLRRYLAPEISRLNGLEPDDLFLKDPATAMTISGPWLFCKARLDPQHEAGDEIAVALPPGPSFVGGSNLVIWKYSRSPEAAVKLIRFLNQPEQQAAYSQHIGLLPSRMGALGDVPFSTDPFWQTAVEGLQSGCSFPTIRLWGLVEDRLKAGLSAVWVDLLGQADKDPQTSLVEHLSPIARRLDSLLKQQG